MSYNNSALSVNWMEAVHRISYLARQIDWSGDIWFTEFYRIDDNGVFGMSNEMRTPAKSHFSFAYFIKRLHYCFRNFVILTE